MKKTVDDLLPTSGEWLRYIGIAYNMSESEYYKVVRVDYSITLWYSVCVVDDEGIETWFNLTDFSLIDEND